MDVVNGKIVSLRAERTSSMEASPWSVLTPSRGRTVESGQGSPEHLGETGRDSRGFGDGIPRKVWGEPGVGACHGVVNRLALESGAGRWNQRPPTLVRTHSSVLQPRPVSEHRQGWGNNARARPCSETNLDQMMATYESLVTRAVSGHFAKLEATASLGQESPTLSLPSVVQPKECSLQRSGSDAGSKQDGEAPTSPKRWSSDLKRKRLESTTSEGADHVDCGWSHPLRPLVRKGLSVSDVGELGRIVIPKKDAESQFQQIDTKEGTLLEMADYTGSKRWFFRFKWWSNNKSRMYVLENTREFIKYHDLKERDIFVVYEDGSRKMVSTSEGLQANQYPPRKRMAPLLRLPWLEESCKMVVMMSVGSSQHNNSSSEVQKRRLKRATVLFYVLYICSLGTSPLPQHQLSNKLNYAAAMVSRFHASIHQLFRERFFPKPGGKFWELGD